MYNYNNTLKWKLRPEQRIFISGFLQKIIVEHILDSRKIQHYEV